MKTYFRAFQSIWAWITILIVIAGTAYLTFLANIQSSKKIRTTLVEMPRSEFVISTSGILEVEGGLLTMPIVGGDEVLKLLVSEGDEVTTGQLLATYRDASRTISSDALPKEIRAPVDGVIAKTSLFPGTVISVQQARTAIVIMPNRRRVIRVGLTESDIHHAFDGQNVEVTSGPQKRDAFRGTVIRISPVYSNAFDTHDASTAEQGVVEVVIDVGDIPLRLGQRVLVKFRGKSADDSKPMQNSKWD